jgi:hypothetical protein
MVHRDKYMPEHEADATQTAGCPALTQRLHCASYRHSSSPRMLKKMGRKEAAHASVVCQFDTGNPAADRAPFSVPDIYSASSRSVYCF